MNLDFEQVIFCAGCSARIAGRHFTVPVRTLLLSFSVLDPSVEFHSHHWAWEVSSLGELSRALMGSVIAMPCRLGVLGKAGRGRAELRIKRAENKIF